MGMNVHVYVDMCASKKHGYPHVCDRIYSTSSSFRYYDYVSNTLPVRLCLWSCTGNNDRGAYYLLSWLPGRYEIVPVRDNVTGLNFDSVLY